MQLGQELREARIGAGLSQRQVAEAASVSHAHVGRVERGESAGVSIVLIARLLNIVGLQLAARAFPGGSTLRDASHVALLKRLQAELPASVRFRTEVPLRGDRDGRAWDGRMDLTGGCVHVEAETRIRDLQALDRRIALKQRDDGVARVMLLVSDTRDEPSSGSRGRDAARHALPAPGEGRYARAPSRRMPPGERHRPALNRVPWA